MMRRLAFNSPSVEEIGYFEDGLLKCTSWGITTQPIEQQAPDFLTAEGISVIVSMFPRVTGGKRMVALQLDNYNLLVDPRRLVDVIVGPAISLALIKDSRTLVSVTDTADSRLLEWIFLHPDQGEREGMLYGTAEVNEWLAIATEPSETALRNWGAALLVFLPFGGLVAAALIGFIVWLSRRSLSPEAVLGIAIKRRELLVVYQPIVSLKTGACVGAEALVRWRLANGTLIPPDQFIPLAEKTGQILLITDFVVDQVIKELGATLVQHRSLHVTINIAADDIKSGRIIQLLTATLAAADVEPRQIWIEATERGFMGVAEAKRTLARCRELGFFVAIDDFGTGYSSLQYLQGLPIDALKIDKAFVDTVGASAATSSVTPHIIAMARELELYTVAEGVEQQAQADYLAARDVDFGQGWLFSRPLPVEEFVTYYDLHRPLVEVRADRSPQVETASSGGGSI